MLSCTAYVLLVHSKMTTRISKIKRHMNKSGKKKMLIQKHLYMYMKLKLFCSFKKKEK